MTIKYENVSCNNCGSSNFELFLDRGDLSTEIPGIFHLVKCSNCGLIFQNPRPTLESWDEIYPDEYDQYLPIQPHPQAKNNLLNTYGVYKRAKLLANLSAGGRVCDIGCSTGEFLMELSRFSQWDCFGVEPKKSAIIIAKSRGLNVHHGMFDESAFPGVQFDIVTLWNVIEHLHDPLATLKEIQNRLNPGGLLVFNTPNLNSWDAFIFKENWIGFELPRHLFVYSEKSINNLLQKAGFTQIKSLCFYGQHAAAMSSIRFVLRSALRTKNQVVENILFTLPARLLFSPIFFLQDKIKKSSQITIVARRSVDL